MKVLSDIADAYDLNDLAGEAKKFTGTRLEHENKKDPSQIILCTGYGGRVLLTLQDCLIARDEQRRFCD